MSYMRFNYRSDAIGRYLDIGIVFPTDLYSYYDASQGVKHHLSPGQKPRPPYQPGMKFQTVYLIHGGGEDDTVPFRYTNAEWYAQKNDVMLVAPDVSNSFGADTNYGVNYATFLAEELPVVIQTLFASSPRREDNFIMGYAMGGNVALAAALARPDRYTACVDLSGGIGMTLDVETLMSELYSEHFSKYFPLYGATFGKAEEVAGSRFDLHAVALKNRAAGQPECRFTLVCGSKEFIRLRMENDARILKELDFDVDYIVAEGYDHDFKMWNDYIELALDKQLPLKRAAIYPDEA